MADTIKWNSWRDNLKEATFRDIPFKVLSHTEEDGRRTALHQFPFNDEPYLEDLGKEAGTYHVEAYICQSVDNAFDYFPLRDAFREALKMQGPGTLVHPFLGTLVVGVQGKYQLKESFAEGGIAKFTIIFVEAGKPQQPSSSPPDIVDIDVKQASLWKRFTAILQTINELGHVVESTIQNAQSYIDAAQGALNMPLSMLNSVISQAQTTLTSLRSTIATVVNYPDQLAASLAQVSQLFASLSDLIPSKSNPTTQASAVVSPNTGQASSIELSPADAQLFGTSLAAACLSLASFGASLPSPSTTTSDGVIVASNQNILVDVVRASSVVEAVRAAVAVEYVSYNDAVNMREQLVAAFDAVLLGIGENSKDDELYQIVDDMKQYAVSTIIAKGANLPVIRSLVVPPDPMPSLAYANRLYDDLGRDAEIVARNPVVMRHPGFPLGGQELKVLSE